LRFKNSAKRAKIQASFLPNITTHTSFYTSAAFVASRNGPS